MTSSELRKLCIENNWFTGGSNEQYEKMFEYNNSIKLKPTLDELHTLAYLIWICSSNITQVEIVEKLIDVESKRKDEL